MVCGWLVVGWRLLAAVGPTQIKGRVLRPSCGCTHVSVCGCGGCSLHAPCTGLRRAAGNCCRMIWRLGRTEGKAALSRRGGREIGGLSGRSVKVPGELLHTVSRRRRMWRRAAEGRWNAAAGWPLGRTSGGASCQGLQQGRPHQGRCGRPRLSLSGAAALVLLCQVCRV